MEKFYILGARRVCINILTAGLATPRGAETELRFLARSFCTEFSAASARSSASSSSLCTLRYLARLMAATSSCKCRKKACEKVGKIEGRS